MSQPDFYTKCAITPQRWKGCSKMAGDDLLPPADEITVTLSTPFIQTLILDLNGPWINPVGFATNVANYLSAPTVPVDTIFNQSGTGLQLVGNQIVVGISGEYVISYTIIFTTFYTQDGVNFILLPIGTPGFPGPSLTATPHMNISFIGINGGTTLNTAKATDWMSFGGSYTDPNGNLIQDYDVPVNSGQIVQYLNAGDTITVQNYAVLAFPTLGTNGGGATQYCELSCVRVK